MSINKDVKLFKKDHPSEKDFVKNYYLEGTTEGQSLEIIITGRSPLFPKTSRPKVQFDANS